MKYNLDYAMKFKLLRIMLEWRLEIDHNWSVKTGAYGKGLQKWIDPEIWKELQGTYVGAGLEENREALFNTIALFRKISGEVGSGLGYAYPHDMERRVMVYLQRVRELDRRAERLA